MNARGGVRKKVTLDKTEHDRRAISTTISTTTTTTINDDDDTNTNH